MDSKNDFLSEEKVSKILSKSGLSALLSSFLLNIKKRKNTVIVCPVGEIEELRNFSIYLKDSGISGLADAVLYTKKALILFHWTA